MRHVAALLFTALLLAPSHAQAPETSVEAVVASLKNLDPGRTSDLHFVTDTMRFAFMLEQVREFTKQPDGSYKKTETRALMVLAGTLGPSAHEIVIMVDFDADGTIDQAIIGGNLLLEGEHPELKKFVRIGDGCPVRFKHCKPSGAEFQAYWQQRYSEALEAYLSQP